MNCRDVIMSEDYADFIVEFASNVEAFLETYKDKCPTPIGISYGTVFEPLERALPISLARHDYQSIPKLYGEVDTVSVEATGALLLQNLPGLNLKGSGTIIGIIDDGIDPYHEAFRFSDGTTRILSAWDQTNQTLEPPQAQNYGSELTHETINIELAKENSELLNSLAENSAHGTFVAGVAAGNINEEMFFASPAPSADLVVVKLKPAKQYLRDYYLINESAAAYQENDILSAIIYMRAVAALQQRPVIICIALGCSQGPHNGSSVMGDFLNNAAGRNGIGVVVANGNEGSARHHYSGKITGESETVEIRVAENQNGFIIELWGEAPNIFSIGVVSPSGEVVNRIPAKIGATFDYTFLFENTRLSVDYRVVERRSGSELVQIRLENPTAGIWKIVVYGDNILSGEYNMWLPITNFVGIDTYFLRPDPLITLTNPADAYIPISVGGYNVATGGIFIDSSRGFTTLNEVKPNFVAPAVQVYGPGIRNTYVSRSGTSAAAALTAGVVAQFMEWGIVKNNSSRMNTAEIKNYLVRGAIRSPNTAYPNQAEGYGKLDAYNSLDILR